MTITKLKDYNIRSIIVKKVIDSSIEVHVLELKKFVVHGTLQRETTKNQK